MSLCWPFPKPYQSIFHLKNLAHLFFTLIAIAVLKALGIFALIASPCSLLTHSRPSTLFPSVTFINLAFNHGISLPKQFSFSKAEWQMLT